MSNKTLCLYLLFLLSTSQVSYAATQTEAAFRLFAFMDDFEEKTRDEPPPKEILLSSNSTELEIDVSYSHLWAEDGRYGDAANTLEHLLRDEKLEPNWIDGIQTRIEILRKWEKTGIVSLDEYKVFFVDLSPPWFGDRMKPLIVLWKIPKVSEAAKYSLLADMMARRGEGLGQFLVLEAIPELDTVTKEESADAMLKIADMVHGAPNNSTAEKMWRRIMREFPQTKSWPIAVYNLGITEQKRGNFKAAVAHFQSLLESKPDDRAPGADLMDIYRNYSHRCAIQLSLCFESTGDYKEALRYVIEAHGKYAPQSWCGNEIEGSKAYLAKRVAELTAKTK